MRQAVAFGLAGSGWNSGPVRFAASFLERLRGIRRGPAVLIPGWSVHGFGMRNPIWAVGLDGSLRVVAIRTLRPGRMVTVPGARYMLELRLDQSPPVVGTALSIVGRWLER